MTVYSNPFLFRKKERQAIVAKFSIRNGRNNNIKLLQELINKGLLTSDAQIRGYKTIENLSHK